MLRTRDPWLRAGRALLGLAAVSLLVRLGRHEQFTQDTTAVLDGSHTTLHCLGGADLWACGYDSAKRVTGVNPYPLLQYLPTMALMLLGLADETIRNVLAWMNALALAAATALVVRFARQRGGPRLGALALIAMGSGMLVSYAGTTLGEPLMLLALVVASWLVLTTEPTAWLAAMTCLAVIGKETILPVVVLYLVGLVLLSPARPAAMRQAYRLIAVGAGLGLAMNLAFNLFRFGQLGNPQYLDQATQPAPPDAAKSFVSLLLSPNGGLLWFWWMAFAALMALVVVLLVGRLASRPRLGLAITLAGFGVGLVSLSIWWMPFGWYSWGPRLLLPLVPPLLLAAAIVLPRLEGRSWRAALAVVGVSGVLLVPNYAFVFAPDRSMTHDAATISEDPRCFRGYDLRTDAGLADFHHCLMRSAWRTTSMPLVEAVEGANDRDPVWFWTTVGLAITGAALVLVRARTLPPANRERVQTPHARATATAGSWDRDTPLPGSRP